MPAAPVLMLMALGVLIALAGHVVRSQRTVVLGLVTLFVATALMVLGAFVAFQADPGDPRPRTDPYR